MYKNKAQEDIKVLLDMGVKDVKLQFLPTSYYMEFDFWFRHIVIEHCFNIDLEYHRDFYFVISNHINNGRLYTKELKTRDDVIKYLVKYRNSFFKSLHKGVQ